MPWSSRTNIRKIRTSFRFICSLNFICYLLLLLLLLLLQMYDSMMLGAHLPWSACWGQRATSWSLFSCSTCPLVPGIELRLRGVKQRPLHSESSHWPYVLQSLSSVQIKYFFWLFTPGGSIFGSFDVNGAILFLQSLLTKMLLVFLRSASKFLFSSHIHHYVDYQW